MSLEIIFNSPDGKRYATKFGISMQEVPNPSPAPQPNPQPQANRYFVLYYGDPLDANFQKIVDTKPAFVILAGIYGKAVTDKYHAAGTKTIAYIPTGYGSKNVNADIDTAMNGGNDGVFFDECDSVKTTYNLNNYARVKATGRDKIVIQNPGQLPASTEIFGACDILCVENFWFSDLKKFNQPADKFMAVQGDPGGSADPRFQSADSLGVAVGRMQTFRNNGGQWYYSGFQNHHWMIAPFLPDFAKVAR